MKIVAFVPIKFNSQRLPNKMFLQLGKKKLCQYIFDVLLDVKSIINLDIYCYCSNEKIKEYLPDDILFLKRPKKYDKNETKGIDIYKSFVKEINADIYILSHATSPFITSNSFIKGINNILHNNYDSAFSVNKIQTFCWYNNETLNYSLDNIVRTQDIKPIYWETSAFYMFKKEVIMNNRRIGNNPYKVETTNIEAIDIDEQKDFNLAKNIIK
jgi:CMP-N-acetylneuraminic acid synthetase